MGTIYGVKFDPTVPIESIDGLIDYLREESIGAELSNSTGHRDWTLTTDEELSRSVYSKIRNHNFITYFRKLPIRD